MFGKCLWLKVNNKYRINSLIKNISNKFNLPLYLGHFTLQYNIKNTFYNNNYDFTELKKTGKLYKTHNNGFYALQQDYITNNNIIYHISIMYKIDKDFNKEELDYINNIIYPQIDNIIYFKDCEVQLMNCNSKYPKEWKDINL